MKNNTKNKKSRPKTGAVIVAAGLSSRMGAFKPMLPLGDSTIIRRVIATLSQNHVDPIIVVTGRRGTVLAEHLTGLATCVHNPQFATTDMFTSAKLGMQAIAGTCERFFFLPADVPLFSSRSIQALLAYQQKHDTAILIPAHQGRNGHPVLLHSRVLPALLTYNGEGGMKGALKAVAETQQSSILNLDDRGLILDADRPEDYQLLLEYEAPEQITSVLQLSLQGKEIFLDETMAQILEQADKQGSLAHACRAAGISYSSGWKKLRAAEELLGFTLLDSSRGGKEGGGSQLTPAGCRLLTAYKKYRASVSRYATKQFGKFFTPEIFGKEK